MCCNALILRTRLKRSELQRLDWGRLAQPPRRSRCLSAESGAHLRNQWTLRCFCRRDGGVEGVYYYSRFQSKRNGQERRSVHYFQSGEHILPASGINTSSRNFFFLSAHSGPEFLWRVLMMIWICFFGAFKNPKSLLWGCSRRCWLKKVYGYYPIGYCPFMTSKDCNVPEAVFRK